MSFEFYSGGNFDGFDDQGDDVTDNIERDVDDQGDDITDDIESDIDDMGDDVTDNVESDIEELVDTEESVDDVLDAMSLDELYELKEDLQQTAINDTVDEVLSSMSLDELYELKENLQPSDIQNDVPPVVDVPPMEVKKKPDNSFHWDGGPTHNTEWDEETEPTTYTKKLTRQELYFI